tara:strand:- start:52 stop:483 length:432 start_codon:yes stop_codon:yes gene_type:complete
MSFGHLNHGKSPLEVSVVTGPSSDIVEFESGGAIVAGQVVRLDTSATGSAIASTIVQGAADGLAIGVALEAAAGAGEIVRVCIGGYIEGVASAAGPIVGETLYAAGSGTVDDSDAGATEPPVGVALTAESGNGFVSLYWFRKY